MILTIRFQHRRAPFERSPTKLRESTDPNKSRETPQGTPRVSSIEGKMVALGSQINIGVRRLDFLSQHLKHRRAQLALGPTLRYC
jgi:hypothetical protein